MYKNILRKTARGFLVVMALFALTNAGFFAKEVVRITLTPISRMESLLIKWGWMSNPQYEVVWGWVFILLSMVFTLWFVKLFFHPALAKSKTAEPRKFVQKDVQL